MTARIALLMVVLVFAAPWSAARYANVLANASGERAHGAMLRIVPRNGPASIESLDGVGCSEAICSHRFVRALALDDEGTVIQNLAFDTIAAIEILTGGEARVRFVDGTSQRVLVAHDNRVLYLLDTAGRTKKVDLGELAAIEFLR